MDPKLSSLDPKLQDAYNRVMNGSSVPPPQPGNPSLNPMPVGTNPPTSQTPPPFSTTPAAPASAPSDPMQSTTQAFPAPPSSIAPSADPMTQSSSTPDPITTIPPTPPIGIASTPDPLQQPEPAMPPPPTIDSVAPPLPEPTPLQSQESTQEPPAIPTMTPDPTSFQPQNISQPEPDLMNAPASAETNQTQASTPTGYDASSLPPTEPAQTQSDPAGTIPGVSSTVAFNASNNGKNIGTTSIKKSGSHLMPVFVGIAILLLLVAYTFVWIVLFNVKIPGLPAF